MTISLRLSHDDSMLIKKYAEFNSMTVSEVIRKAVMEKIEDEYDTVLFEKALKEFNENPVTYSLDEIESELGLK